MKAYRGDPDECAIVVLERNAGGIEVIDAAKSRIRVVMEHSHTSKFMEGVEYYWDVQVEDTPLAIPLHGNLKARHPPGVGKAPKITSQPVGGTIPVGQVLSVSVVASGKAPLIYQWRKNGITIAGATSSTYSYTTTATTDSGNYDVVVSNPFGNTTSNVAVWQVGVGPFVTTHPTGGTFNVGDVLSLSVVASGEAPLSYQWRRNGTSITSATSSIYTIMVDVSDAGAYDCVVSNPFGVAFSNTALVYVTAEPPVVTGALLREDGTPLLREDGTAYQREVLTV